MYSCTLCDIIGIWCFDRFFKFSSLYNIEQYARTLNEQKIEEEKLGDLKTIFQSTNNFCLIKSYFKINTKKINARFFEEIILKKK